MNLRRSNFHTAEETRNVKKMQDSSKGKDNKTPQQKSSRGPASVSPPAPAPKLSSDARGFSDLRQLLFKLHAPLCDFCPDLLGQIYEYVRAHSQQTSPWHGFAPTCCGEDIHAE
jgi:hypothetical protein